VKEEFEKAEKGAKNEDMVSKVKMFCKICGKRLYFKIYDACEHCGLIEIRCKTCGYDYWFGE